MMYAEYKGTEYPCSMIHGGKIIKLMSERPLEGFSKGMSSYVKQVERSACERVYKKELCFKYKNDSFLVCHRDNGKVLLETGPRSYNLIELGFERVLQDTFQKWVDETDGELYWNETEY